MVSIDSLTLFRKSMYVMTQFHYFPHNLATMTVSELQILFVNFYTNRRTCCNFKFFKIFHFKIGHFDLVVLALQYLYYLWLNPHFN